MDAPSFNGELNHRVRLCLSTATHAVLRGLVVEVNQQTVILSGTVGTFYEKQLAQEIVRHVAGVRQVVNLVQVEPEEANRSTQEGPSSAMTVRNEIEREERDRPRHLT